MEPMFLMALLSLVATDLPPAAALANPPCCQGGTCMLSVPVTAEICPSVANVAGEVARRPVMIAGKVGACVKKAAGATAKRKPLRRTAGLVAKSRPCRAAAAATRLIVHRRRC
jgi:hypothetical protein